MPLELDSLAGSNGVGVTGISGTNYVNGKPEVEESNVLYDDLYDADKGLMDNQGEVMYEDLYKEGQAKDKGHEHDGDEVDEWYGSEHLYHHPEDICC